MLLHRLRDRRPRVAVVFVLMGLLLGGLALPAAPALAQSTPVATPSDAGDPCADPAAAAPAMPDHGGAMMAATPMAGMPMHGMGTPPPGMPGGMMRMEFDQGYIDMMIPHHASIVAMAEAALTRLEEERLRAIAQAVIDAQRPEIEELRQYRERFYGSPDPLPMAGHGTPGTDPAMAAMREQMMGQMAEMMPGMGSMDEMMFQMDAVAQVAAICGAENADLAFIDLTIPHHEMAITASEAALTRAVHPEIRDFALRVIDTQQAEIDALTAIRAELAGTATPRAAGGGADHTASHAGQGAAAGGEEVAIRSLPADLVAQIERGEGAGLAMPAEANGVPGPRHALDLADELGLSAEQRERLQGISDEMAAAALPAGERYLAALAALEADFREGVLTQAELPARVAEVSRLEGDLAAVHLAAHLETAAVLTPEQVEGYYRFRPAG